jgi:hypothetical protein
MMSFFSIFFVIFTSILKLFLLVFLGFIAVRQKIFSPTATKDFSNYVINFSLPALLFTILIEKLNQEIFFKSLIFPLGALIIVSLGLGLGFLSAYLFKIKNPRQQMIACLCGFGNAGYLPLPLISMIIPACHFFPNPQSQVKEALVYLSFYLLVWCSIQWTVGKWLISNFHQKQTFKFSLFFSPPILGIFSGTLLALLGGKNFFLHQFWLGKIIFTSLNLLGQTTIPVIMFTLGGLLAGINLKKMEAKNLRHLLLSALVKLIFLPAFGLFFMVSLGQELSLLAKFILFLECTVPPATALAVMSKKYEADYEFVSLTIFITYLLCLLTIPWWLSCFFKFFLN